MLIFTSERLESKEARLPEGTEDLLGSFENPVLVVETIMSLVSLVPLDQAYKEENDGTHLLRKGERLYECTQNKKSLQILRKYRCQGKK